MIVAILAISDGIIFFVVCMGLKINFQTSFINMIGIVVGKDFLLKTSVFSYSILQLQAIFPRVCCQR